MKRLLVVAIALVSAFDVQARDAYVSDQQVVTLRSGQGTEFRIVHRGLRSGTKLSILEEDEGNGYTKVKTAAGIEGWILSRFLMNTPSARSQLAEIKERMRVASQSESEQVQTISDLTQQRDSLTDQLATLQSQYNVLTAEYGELRIASGDVINLQNQNLSLGENNAKLSARVEIVTAENQRLRDDRTTSQWLWGALIALGGFITALMSGAVKSRRRTSDW